MNNKKRFVIGISGASGAPLAITLLRALQDRPDIETHLVISNGARITTPLETGLSLYAVEALADVLYDNKNIGASIACGSFKTDGMIVVPCSMKTLAAINCGYADNLIQRAADVTIKEHRKLALVTRECPLSPIHLKNMYELSRIGVYILPPVISYYNLPETVEDVTRQIVGKILDVFDIDYEHFVRWDGMDGTETVSKQN